MFNCNVARMQRKEMLDTEEEVREGGNHITLVPRFSHFSVLHILLSSLDPPQQI